MKVLQFQVTEESSMWQGKTLVLLEDGNLYTQECCGIGGTEYIEGFAKVSPNKVYDSYNDFAMEVATKTEQKHEQDKSDRLRKMDK